MHTTLLGATLPTQGRHSQGREAHPLGPWGAAVPTAGSPGIVSPGHRFSQRLAVPGLFHPQTLASGEEHCSQGPALPVARGGGPAPVLPTARGGDARRVQPGL